MLFKIIFCLIGAGFFIGCSHHQPVEEAPVTLAPSAVAPTSNILTCRAVRIDSKVARPLVKEGFSVKEFPQVGVTSGLDKNPSQLEIRIGESAAFRDDSESVVKSGVASAANGGDYSLFFNNKKVLRAYVKDGKGGLYYGPAKEVLALKKQTQMAELECEPARLGSL